MNPSVLSAPPPPQQDELTAQCLRVAATCDRDRGAYTLADARLSRCVAIFAKVCGPNHPQTKDTRMQLQEMRERFKDYYAVGT